MIVLTFPRRVLLPANPATWAEEDKLAMKLIRRSHELGATSKTEPDNSHSMEIAQIVFVQPIEQGANDRSDFWHAIASRHVVDGLRSKPPIYLQKLSEHEIIDSTRPLISYHQWKWNWSCRDQAELGRLSDGFRRWHCRSIREFWGFQCLNKIKVLRCSTHDILIGKSRRKTLWVTDVKFPKWISTGLFRLAWFWSKKRTSLSASKLGEIGSSTGKPRAFGREKILVNFLDEITEFETLETNQIEQVVQWKLEASAT